MLLTTTLTSIALSLPFLTSSAATPVAARQDAYEPVAFTNDWPTQFCAGSTYEISYTGGSGTYNAWQWKSYPGLPDTHPYPLGDGQTDTTVTWQAPYWKDLEPDTTFSFSVLDADANHPESGWIAYSPTIPVNHCV